MAEATVGSTLTAELCGFVAGTSFDDLPREVIHEAKRLTLDLIADAIAGYDSELGRIVAGYAARMGGHPRATVIGNAAKTSPAMAAHVNARCADALDFTDTFMNWYHVGPPGVLSALAECEAAGAGGKEFLAAAALGTEVGIRLSLGPGDPSVPPPPGSAGHTGLGASGRKAIMPDYLLAAAAAASKALGLDAQKMAYAFAIAATNAPYGMSSRWLEQPSIPLQKYADVGQDLYLGIYSAEMASLGLTAHPAVLDGKNPLWKIRQVAEFKADRVRRDLGKRWFILDNTYKLWPSCRFTHHALTAFSNVLAGKGIRAGELERVLVRTHPWAVMTPHFRDKEPEGMITCEFNIPHALAMVALGVTRGPSWYSARTLADPAVKAFRRKVDVELEETCRNPEQWYVDGQVGRLPTRVLVHARGQVFEGHTEYAAGDPRSPATFMSDEALFAKFRDAALHRSDGSAAWDRKLAHAAESVFELDKANDVSRVMQRLAKALRPRLGPES